MASYTIEEHEAMMRDPDRWPLWPILPLKQEGGDWVLGVIFGDPDGDKVWFAAKDMIRVTEEDLTERTIPDLLAEGWRVD